MGSRRTIDLRKYGISGVEFANAMQKRMDELAGKDVKIEGVEFHVTKKDNGLLFKPEGWDEAVKAKQPRDETPGDWGKKDEVKALREELTRENCPEGFVWVFSTDYIDRSWVEHKRRGYCRRLPRRE